MPYDVPSRISLTSTQQAEIERISQTCTAPDGFRWMRLDDIPTLIPEGHRAKFTDALLIWERQSSGITAIVCNAVRFDAKASAFDQEPVAVAIHSSGVSTGAIAVHHGSWAGRTTPAEPREGEGTMLSTTSLGRYYPLSRIPSRSSGALSELEGTSHAGAFDTAVKLLFPPKILP